MTRLIILLLLVSALVPSRVQAQTGREARLLLTVVDQTGNYPEPCRVTVNVQN